MINIQDLFHSPNGEQEVFDWTFEANEFTEQKLLKPVRVQGKLLRTEEGIVMIIESLTSQLERPCARCEKILKRDIKVTGSEWTYYEEKRNLPLDPSEQLRIDCNRLEINPMEALRQELDLATPQRVVCEPECVHFEGEERGVKALSGLKNLTQIL